MKSLANLIVAFSGLTACAVTNECTISDPGLTSVIVATDSVQYTDHSTGTKLADYEPTFFRFTDQFIIHTTNLNRDIAFRILERPGFYSERGWTVGKIDWRVYSLCNAKEYEVRMDLIKDGHITFIHPERTIKFHVLSVTKR